ncbi:MAG: phosphatase PAP2 family protein [Parcubacteria group bacterium]|nr:phosphatase PAP2 family protein [Parcubacteria group bacterium]
MHLDQTILQFFAENRIGWVSLLMLIITYSGGLLMVGAITFLSILALYIRKYKVFILPLFVSVFGSTLTVLVFKQIFYRARPLSEAFYLETSLSFPSAHTAVATALYGLLIYILYKSKLKSKFLLIAGLCLLIFLIGFSRLYLGVHYFSDVLMGYLLGLIWIWISIKLSKNKSIAKIKN